MSFKRPIFEGPKKINQTFNPALRAPQRPQLFNRTLFPEKIYDPQIIAQLLLKASTENNFIDLKKFIMENGITTNDMLNEEGQSIIHLILLNVNLTPRQKLEMIRYFRDNSTLIMSYDKLNQTPLHLACKLQLVEIVEELIKCGHDVNCADSSYKTPLHYSIIGKSTEPPLREEKPIIPKNKKKIKINSVLIPDIMTALVKYMETPNIKNFILNQFNTMKNINSIFPEKITSILENEKNTDAITNLVEDITLTKTKQQIKIYDLKSESINQIKQYVHSLLIETKKQLKLKPNTENGWGPDINVVNKIMEYENISDIYKIYTDDLILKKKSIDDKINISGVNSIKLINELGTEIHTRINNIMKGLYFTIKFFHEIEPLTDMFTQKYVNHLNILEFSENDIKQNFIYNPNQIGSNIYISGLFTKEIYDFVTNTLHLNGRFTDIPQETSLIQEMMFDPRNLEIDTNYNTMLTEFYTDYINVGAGGSITGDDFGGFPIDAYMTGDFPYITNTSVRIVPYSISRKFDWSFMKIVQIIDIINTQIQTINMQLDNPNNLIKHINDTIISIMGFLNELPKYLDERNKCIKSLENIVDLIKTKNTTIIEMPLRSMGDKIFQMNTFYFILLDNYDSLIKKMKTEQDKTQLNLFNTIKFYYELVNEMISYQNEKKGLYFISQYFNNFTDIDTIFTNPQTFQIENIMKESIQNLPNFFTSYEDILTVVKISDDELIQIKNKTDLFNRFMLQTSSKNIYNFIKSPTNPEPIQDAMVGFLQGLTQFNNLHINLSELKLIFGADGIPPLIQNANNNKIGLYKVEQGPLILNKSDSIYNIMSVYFDKFYMIQKYLITRYVLNNIFQNLSVPIQPISELISKIKLLKIELDNLLNTNADDYSIVLISVAKLIDKIFNTNIDNIIATTINETFFNLKTQNTYNLTNITMFNKIDVSTFDYEDINAELYKLFKKKQRKTSEFVYRYAENISKQHSYKDNVYKISGSNIGDNPNELYMEFNSKLIDLLINNGANVNCRDKDGNTPIAIAIIQNNIQAIDLLLKTNISVNTKKSKNRFGYKPLDLCKNTLKTSIDNFYTEINPSTIKNYIKEINSELMTITKVSHVMRHSDIIVGMLLYLLNHVFYSKLNNYLNYSDNNLHDIIFSQIINQIEELPLLHPLKSNDTKINIYENMNNVLNNELKSYNDLKKTDLEENEKINHLNGEKFAINSQTSPNTYRTNEIKDRLTKIKIKNPIDEKIQHHVAKLNKFNRNLLKNIRNKLKQFKTKSNPLESYELIINEILGFDSEDYRTYTLLWEILLKNNTLNDDIQIINKIFNLIQNNNEDNQIIQNCSNVLNIICIDINNYFMLPNEYGESNYSLTEVMNILIHITKNTMIVNLYHLLLKLLRNELKSKISKTNTGIDYIDDQNYSNLIDEKIKEIITSRYNNISLKEYLFDIIPEKIVKISLEIFEYEDDDDKTKNIIELLSYIDKLLYSNSQSLINKDDSKLIKILNQNVYPYFKNYFEINIKKLKKITDGYYSMLNNFSNKLVILNKILLKAQTEL